MFFKAKNDKSSKSSDLPPDKKIVQSKAKKNERKAGKTVAESPVAAKVKGGAVSGTSKKAELVNSTKEKAEASNKKVSDFAAERKTSDQTQNRISESDAASQAADEANQYRSAAVAYTDQILANIEGILRHSIEISNERYNNLNRSLTECYNTVVANRTELYPAEIDTSEEVFGDEAEG